MRALLAGTVNGKAFTLNENGKVKCEDSKLCNVIYDGALAACDRIKQKKKDGLNPIVVLDIADGLEECKAADIQVNEAYEYEHKATLIHYLHVPNEVDCSKRRFLKGRLGNGVPFEVLVDLSVKVGDGEFDIESSGTIHMILEDLAYRFRGPSIPDRNYALYQLLHGEVPYLIVEQACFYSHPLIPGVIY